MRRNRPLTYYYRTGPIGQLFRVLGDDPRLARVGIIGLGSGSLTAYARGGQHWTYFEIDPVVERIATDPSLFTFYRDAQARGARVDTVVGDARVTLQRSPEKFGVIVIDAFSSDAIPIHLLTREALRVYLDHLQDGGFLLFNISNRYLDLEPILVALARDARPPLWCLVGDDRHRRSDSEKAVGMTPSHWLILARDQNSVGGKPGIAWDWRRPLPGNDQPVWTDDYSNLFRVLKLRADTAE
jgi:hypothetical protein